MTTSSQIASPYDRFLAPRLEARVPGFGRYRDELDDFHTWVLTEVDAQANATDRDAPPRLETYDREGQVVNRIVLNAPYEAQHREVYRRGIVGRPYREGAPHLLSFALGYLLSQADISLHCPVTLTGAVAYVLGHHAPAALRERYLPDVARMDGHAKTGGTWATELHGGSDVGATTTEARPQGEHYTLHGLKWFTSNANSGLALATARPTGAPPGSAGLGLYLVPSHLEDGRVNHYRVRRLKDKLGTRGLPTGEIDLLGAHAVEVAPPPEGFRLMMEALTYSRVHNAVGAAGAQRRALSEALAWATRRRAFGHAIVRYPMVQATLVEQQVRWRAGTLLAFEAALALDEALHDPARRTWLRLSTALAKYLTAEEAVSAARGTLELIGGNGYTSDYPAARLLRDAQVLTVWEGPANVQALELLRLLAPRYGGFEVYEARVQAILAALHESLDDLRMSLTARLAGDRQALAVTTASPEQGQRYARQLLHRLATSLAFALLTEDAAREEGRGDPTSAAAARVYQELLTPPAFGEENWTARQLLLDDLMREVPGAD
ncbi:acyl-CoA dehydrogenase (plasmid) [Deinococcus metallilatus]|uniref:Acyl-CoA dehydrogenase n=2 Tax=Deinococcus metallilatus TaxID=1211322 RepID=A0AAJ5F5R9_9DEIO|nr:acyl-CoA dehydrogenase family protein [Deinococcus metallilatus]MBB5297284.1 alkylation response protein AidB-like acyl-CoA dehydrogenase [Deinococcus metallilatus]QBY06970.1 acyl-CoA dehydrogenase [Deinococcus metallilatus]TLK31917.1 acyl-CoA dehydrogenase [Deinococcus metallilatus]GMA17152.1 acyl-CoA dehydrogenase [Deinococcus metallilatus]